MDDTETDTTATATSWLLASDPAIRWQTMRDVLGEPEEIWRLERARVETEGWGAELLARQDPDGQWAGGGYVPGGFTRELWETEGQPWTATAFVLHDLREWGLDPDTDVVRRTVELVGANARWDHDGQPFWEGEVEECINGGTVADGAYFGADIAAIVTRLLGERQPDGGWNCERANGSTRSSFDTTINVLEGLLEFERAGHGSQAVAAARRAGEEFLLQRNLFRRLSTGDPADEDFLKLTHPSRWYYDVLRGLDYFRAAGEAAGAAPDPRLAEALDWLRGRRLPDGRWPLDRRPPGRVWFHVDDGEGMPSTWVTLRAMRVLRWAGADPALAGGAERAES